MGTIEAEIVGVVGAVRPRGFDSPPRPELFIPHAQAPNGAMTYVVRTVGDPAASVPAIQSVVWDAAPNLTSTASGSEKMDDKTIVPNAPFWAEFFCARYARLVEGLRTGAFEKVQPAFKDIEAEAEAAAEAEYERLGGVAVRRGN